MSRALRLRTVVLAGGAARRMGGGHKPLLALGDRTLLDRILERLAAQEGVSVGAVVLNVDDTEQAFARFNLPTAPDGVAGRVGPLAGVLAGLEFHAQGGEAYDFLLSVPGDAPWIPLDLTARLAAAATSERAAVARAASAPPGVGNIQAHPVAALWKPELAVPLRRALEEEGVRKVEDFTSRFAVATVAWSVQAVGGDDDPFRNLNAPEDLARAEAALKEGGGE